MLALEARIAPPRQNIGVGIKFRFIAQKIEPTACASHLCDIKVSLIIPYHDHSQMRVGRELCLARQPKYTVANLDWQCFHDAKKLA
jgi:hypothetical protein